MAFSSRRVKELFISATFLDRMFRNLLMGGRISGYPEDGHIVSIRRDPRGVYVFLVASQSFPEVTSSVDIPQLQLSFTDSGGEETAI